MTPVSLFGQLGSNSALGGGTSTLDRAPERRAIDGRNPSDYGQAMENAAAGAFGSAPLLPGAAKVEPLFGNSQSSPAIPKSGQGNPNGIGGAGTTGPGAQPTALLDTMPGTQILGKPGAGLPEVSKNAYAQFGGAGAIPPTIPGASPGMNEATVAKSAGPGARSVRSLPAQWGLNKNTGAQTLPAGFATSPDAADAAGLMAALGTGSQGSKTGVGGKARAGVVERMGAGSGGLDPLNSPLDSLDSMGSSMDSMMLSMSGVEPSASQTGALGGGELNFVGVGSAQPVHGSSASGQGPDILGLSPHPAGTPRTVPTVQMSSHEFLNAKQAAQLNIGRLNSQPGQPAATAAAPQGFGTELAVLGPVGPNGRTKKNSGAGGFSANGDTQLNVAQNPTGNPAAVASTPDVRMAQVVPGAMAKLQLSTDASRAVGVDIRNLAQQGGGEMRIRLRPENLGELQIRVQARGNQVDIQVHAKNEQSKRIIEESLSGLKDSLLAQNLTVGSIEIGTRGSEPSGNRNQGGGSEFSQNTGNPFSQQNMDNPNSGSNRWDRYDNFDSGLARSARVRPSGALGVPQLAAGTVGGNGSARYGATAGTAAGATGLDLWA